MDDGLVTLLLFGSTSAPNSSKVVEGLEGQAAAAPAHPCHAVRELKSAGNIEPQPPDLIVGHAKFDESVNCWARLRIRASRCRDYNCKRSFSVLTFVLALSGSNDLRHFKQVWLIYHHLADCATLDPPTNQQLTSRYDRGDPTRRGFLCLPMRQGNLALSCSLLVWVTQRLKR
ncbi:hypothetical protein BD289DRAFT_33341 [Coniella lustricola]|uniref:Uncharacterized protein n=1 Tax=Coniella lustricola TaxID=2025994 RepID=A0A2T3A2K3_9PEZI|nr:hypothetical protein BD289DRAFT_33341 [Coniella lustricola]